MLNILLDTNTVIDFALGREPWFSPAQEIMRAVHDERVNVVFSATSLKDVYYIARKAVGVERAQGFIAFLMDACSIAPVTLDTCRLALEEEESDFEDAIIAAVTREQAVDVIISRDEKAFLRSCAPKMSSRQFVEFFLRADSSALIYEMDLSADEDGGKDVSLRTLENPGV